MFSWRRASCAVFVLWAGCSSVSEPSNDTEDAVKVDTRSPSARAQYDANVRFVNGYLPQCTRGSSGSSGKRVLVSGFGRFLDVTDNATGRIVADLIPEARYPETTPPAAGHVDPPGPQLSVALGTLDLAGIGTVDVCAMILPVYWDVASILLAKEIDAFGPDLVLMNGVAGERQDLWLELGSVNRAQPLDDGSDVLRPAIAPGDSYAPLVPSAARAETEYGHRMSWSAVRDSAAAAIDARSRNLFGGEKFGDILTGVELAGYPRASNTYLCNNVAYTTNYFMRHPDEEVSMLEASTSSTSAPNSVKVKVTRDLTNVPRAFLHWPSVLAGAHIHDAAYVLSEVIRAQLAAALAGDAPTLGDNRDAAPDLAAGAHF
jgi:pyrrolidone-carboxylate peptidase